VNIMPPVQAGSTDVSTIIEIVDSIDGSPETGVSEATASIDLEYRREKGTVVNIAAAALVALDSAHVDGGIEHIRAGSYRLDLPDAAVAAAAGVTGVWVGGTIPNMDIIPTYIPIVPYNPYADAIGAGGAALTDLPWNPDWDVEVQSEAADALTAYDPPTKAELDAAVVPLALGADLATVAGYLDTEVAAIKAKTDNLPSDPADASVVAGLIAALETKVDTIDTLADAIKAKTDALPSDPADASVVAGLIAALEAKVDIVDGVADAVKVVTDALGAAAAARLALSALGIIGGAAAAGTLSTTEITTNLTEATDDHYNGRAIVFTSGALAGQASAVTDYVGATKKLVVVALTEAPANGDTFVLV
jgi:hypothetical protein